MLYSCSSKKIIIPNPGWDRGGLGKGTWIKVGDALSTGEGRKDINFWSLWSSISTMWVSQACKSIQENYICWVLYNHSKKEDWVKPLNRRFPSSLEVRFFFSSSCLLDFVFIWIGSSRSVIPYTIGLQLQDAVEWNPVAKNRLCCMKDWGCWQFSQMKKLWLSSSQVVHGLSNIFKVCFDQKLTGFHLKWT